MSRPYAATVPPFKDSPRVNITIIQKDGRQKTRVVAEHMLKYLLEDHMRIVSPGNVVNGIHADFSTMTKAEMLTWVDAHQHSDSAAHAKVRAMMDKQSEEELRRTLNAMNPIQGTPMPHPEDQIDSMNRDEIIHWILTTGAHTGDTDALEAVLRGQSMDELRAEAKAGLA